MNTYSKLLFVGAALALLGAGCAKNAAPAKKAPAKDSKTSAYDAARPYTAAYNPCVAEFLKGKDGALVYGPADAAQDLGGSWKERRPGQAGTADNCFIVLLEQRQDAPLSINAFSASIHDVALAALRGEFAGEGFKGKKEGVDYKMATDVAVDAYFDLPTKIFSAKLNLKKGERAYSIWCDYGNCSEMQLSAIARRILSRLP